MDSYREKLNKHKRIVVKVGTTSLTYDNGCMDFKKIDNLSWVLTDLRNRGKDVILVSSGAIAVGADRLGLKERPKDIVGKQAASAVGQAVLMQIYQKFFMEYNQKVAQILITKGIFDHEVKRRNAKNTMEELLKLGVIPIVNENDTVAIEELNEFSDNDTLSAYVAKLLKSDLLIILSDIDGMYRGDPNINSDAEIIHTVFGVNDEIYSLAGGSNSSLGTGGMVTKVKAAKFVNDNGIDMIIASGEKPTVVFDIIEGKNVGTLFTAN
ncbi:MAG: glutamate 5-kinase [Clostridiales bacterium]|nr:glutamate 5-kinase [Clostridiales bacterium]